ncbi:hypothetical protein ACH5RR_024521 [Cinchona calisaya]|uniref:Uncharacterized protein n=1 Tax=Cinchona calisaya TaxID=153742 RepID=A0ABD2YY34_9GENT
MDMATWCNYGNGDHPLCCCWSTIYSAKFYDRFISYTSPATGSKSPVWKHFWRKIKKEKKRLMLDCSSSSSSMRFAYDLYTYSQKFDDQGLTWADPDHFSRSFSDRFALPSRIFDKDVLVVV